MSDISTWSQTAGSNIGATPDFLSEGCAPSSVNDAFRELQASIRRQYDDAQWFKRDTPTRSDNDTFTVATDLTAIYTVGRRLKMTGSATAYCTISASVYSAPNTVIDVVMDTGNIPATLTSVYLGILTPTNSSIPVVTTTATMTLTGFASPPTGTARFTKIGNRVFALLPYLSGTSSTVAMTMTGIPSGYQPVTYDVEFPCWVWNNSAIEIGLGYVVAGTGTITFWRNGTSTFTASGTKAAGSSAASHWSASWHV